MVASAVRRRRQLSLGVRIVLAVVVSVVMAFPLWIMIVTALSGRQVFGQTFDVWPKTITFANFERVFAAWPVRPGSPTRSPSP